MHTRVTRQTASLIVSLLALGLLLVACGSGDQTPTVIVIVASPTPMPTVITVVASPTPPPTAPQPTSTPLPTAVPPTAPQPTSTPLPTAVPPTPTPPPQPAGGGITPANAHQLTEVGQVAVGPARQTLAWSPDGRWLALAREDTATGTAWLALFDAQSLTPVSLSTPVRASHLAFSPDGRFLAASFYDNLQDHLVVWDAVQLVKGDTAEVSSFTDSFGGILGLAFSPDSQLLALAVSAAQGSLVPLLEAETGQLQRTLQASYQGVHPPLVLSVAFSPDGRLVVAGLYGGSVQGWQAADGTQVVSFRASNANQPNEVHFLPDGRLLTLDGSSVSIWQLDGAQAADAEGENGLYSGALSPDGQLLAAASSSGVELWDTARLQRVHRLDSGDVVRIAFSPDGALLAALADDGLLRIWGLGAGGRQAPLADRYEYPWLLALAILQVAGYTVRETVWTNR